MIEELRRELVAAGIRGAHRDRIVAEFADHLACDPDADLGDPRELARQFADELGTSVARRTAAWTFLALAGTAMLLLVPPFLLVTYPDIATGRSLVLAGVAGVAVFVGAQLAFVAGSLAALRAWRVRRERTVPAAEARLLRRRSLVGSLAALAAACGVALYVANFSDDLPAWWALLAIGCATTAAVTLVAASLAAAAAGRPRVAVAGEAGGIASDLGASAAGLGPGALAAVVGAGAVALAFASGWIVEGSAMEGAVRGALETVAFAGCWLALGRSLGVRDT